MDPEQPLPDMVLDLAKGSNFAALTTVMPGGSTQTHVMWVDADEHHILLNTEVHRQKYRNVQRDARATVMIWEKDNPYTYAEIRGVVVEKVRGAEARRHIDALSQRYTGRPFPDSSITSERVVLKIRPDRITTRGF